MTLPNFDLSGKGAIITGSSRGIGRAIAEGFAAQGANVIISSRKAAACDAAAAAINARGRGKATAIVCNVGDKADIQNLVARSREALGAIDIAIFLASDAGRYITGQTIVVDGGATITAAGI